MSETLLDRLGGITAVAMLVFRFYERVLRSPRLAPYFRSVELARLIEHQTTFLAQVCGGPPRFTDPELRDIHLRHAITGEAFDEMLAILQATLGDQQLDAAAVRTIVAAFAGRRAVIVAAEAG